MKFKNWQDYEKLRDPNKLLIIYGAGVSGRHFLNVNKVIPDYFADKNFAGIKEVVSKDKKHRISCISPQELEKKLKTKAADVIVSVIDMKILRSISSWFKQIKLNKDVRFYYYHDFNIDTGKIEYYIKTIFINEKTVFNGKFSPARVSNKIFKKAMQAFKNKISTRAEYLNMLRLNSSNIIYKNNFLQSESGEKIKQNKIKNTIYLIGACTFLSIYSSSKENRIDYILQKLLNKYKVNFYNIEDKLVISATWNEIHLSNLKNLVLKKGDIVIASHITKPELALQAKCICEKQGCRFISYSFRTILSRKYLSDYETSILKRIAP